MTPANYLLIVVNLAGGAQVLCRVLEVAEKSLRSAAELVRRGVVRIQLNGSEQVKQILFSRNARQRRNCGLKTGTGIFFSSSKVEHL